MNVTDKQFCSCLYVHMFCIKHFIAHVYMKAYTATNPRAPTGKATQQGKEKFKSKEITNINILV